MFVSCFYFFYSYFVYLHFFLFLCIYLFIFFFLFQKDSSFFNMFYNEKNFFLKLYFCLIRCRSPGFPQGFFKIEMAPRAAPHSGCPGRPALPCLSPAPQGTGSDWKNLPGTAQFLSTQTDTMFAFIYKMGGFWKSK